MCTSYFRVFTPKTHTRSVSGRDAEAVSVGGLDVGVGGGTERSVRSSKGRNARSSQTGGEVVLVGSLQSTNRRCALAVAWSSFCSSVFRPTVCPSVSVSCLMPSA